MEYFHYSWKKRIVLKKMKEFKELSLPLQRDITIYQHHNMILKVPLFKELEPIEILSIVQKLKYTFVSFEKFIGLKNCNLHAR